MKKLIKLRKKVAIWASWVCSNCRTTNSGSDYLCRNCGKS